MKTILFDAIDKDNKEICKIIIAKIGDKDPVDPEAPVLTALHSAVRYQGNLEICKILIKHAIDKNPQDDIYRGINIY